MSEFSVSREFALAAPAVRLTFAIESPAQTLCLYQWSRSKTFLEVPKRLDESSERRWCLPGFLDTRWCGCMSTPTDLNGPCHKDAQGLTSPTGRSVPVQEQIWLRALIVNPPEQPPQTEKETK